MKRGIIRIIAGVVMILLQLAALAGNASMNTSASANIWFNIGYYGIGITGVILLIFGIRALRNEFRSHLILHANNKKIHTVVKWISFVIATILFVTYLASYIYSWDDFDIYTILMILSTLSFAVYLLFYVNKKPSCLFSTTLICIGVAYLYNLVYQLGYHFDLINDTSFVIFSFIPRLIIGILYIIIAVKLFRESFSSKAIKVMGWIAFVLEFINRIIYYIFVLGGRFFNYIDLVLYFLLVTALFLYISVFKVNTLKESTVKNFEDTIRFCRKCGAKLNDNGKFCEQCGTKVVKE